MEREFKFYRDDFGQLPVKALHMDLVFDVHDDHTKVTNDFKLKTLSTPLKELTLNAKQLEIIKVNQPYTYDKKQNLLRITFPEPIPPDTAFTIHTESVCKPTTNVLEGLYYDTTPKGNPPTQITQCQQWGFQRIVPCLDDMTAKCTYRTTIIANATYTNLITNGDVVQERKQHDATRDVIIYENMKTPMAPYLFFLGCGTWDTFTKTLEYPDGTTFTLELLAPAGTNSTEANHALDILYHGILWINLFTGPEQYQHLDKKQKIWNLIKQRDISPGNEAIRDEIKQLLQGLTLGYTYTGTVYREIAMQNSDIGGMENVGNTTITANRLLPFKDMVDPAFEYMIRVKLHEFYHNLNGSEVTGLSPFEIWLNEAVTVHVELQYHEAMMGEAYSRLQSVLYLLGPGGIFEEDTSAQTMPIEPEGFNDTNELITGITYAKAPEFVRMIQTLIGKESFVKGLDAYHTLYKHGNASRHQWIASMEQASGLDLQHTAETWLRNTGYPTVNVHTKDATVTLTQDKEWQFPFVLAAVDGNGNVIEEKNLFIKDKTTTVTFPKKPAFFSLNRDASFYGKVVHNAPDAELFLQAQLDKDATARYMAFYTLADKEMMRLLQDKNSVVSNEFITLYHKLLTSTLPEKLGSIFLIIPESVENETYTHRYEDLYQAKRKLLRSIAQANPQALRKLYDTTSTRAFTGTYVEQQVRHIKNRQVKNLCLQLLATLDTEEIHALIKTQFDNATNATDKLVAFRLYLDSSAPDNIDLMKSYGEEAKQNYVKWEAYLGAIGSNDSKDPVALIKQAEQSDHFNIEQANDHRALYGRFSQNKRISLLTEKGRVYFKDILTRMTQVNEYGTGIMLQAFGKINHVQNKQELIMLLEEVLATVSPQERPSVYNTIKRILTAAKAN